MIHPIIQLNQLPIGDLDCKHETRKAVFVQLNDEESEAFFECECVLRSWTGQFEFDTDK